MYRDPLCDSRLEWHLWGYKNKDKQVIVLIYKFVKLKIITYLANRCFMVLYGIIIRLIEVTSNRRTLTGQSTVHVDFIEFPGEAQSAFVNFRLFNI